MFFSLLGFPHVCSSVVVSIVLFLVSVVFLYCFSFSISRESNMHSRLACSWVHFPAP